MGGNQKANRTKGNTRPSCSGRSAELLANNGVSIQGFIGFHNQARDKAVVPVTGAGFEDEGDAVGLDGDFRMVMRKMGKRDVTTKLKAIQEFGELCEDRDLEVLKATLPFWPRIFNKLSLDHDRRVREATHVTNKTLVVKVERHIAPYLKSLMETWFISTCDSYPPASSAAMEALKTTFPANKLPNALMHCKAEIMSVIEDNLLNATISSLSDPKILSKEEMESRYGNIVSASLLSLSLFLEIVDPEDHIKIQPNISTILVNPKFWKLGKHKDIRIKASFFKLISSLCQHVPNLIQEYSSKSCSVVFTNLDTAEPTVSPYIWEAALHIIVTIQDFWNHINMYKVVIPQLLSVLRSCGHGNASVIYPNILLLVSKFPEEVFLSDRCFFAQFLEIIRSSLNEKLPNSEQNAIMTTYIEIFTFTINKIKKCSNELNPYNLTSFIQSNFIDLIKSSIFEKDSSLSNSTLYELAAHLLFDNKEDNEIATVFWERFNDILETYFKSPEEKNEIIVLNRLFNIIQCFINPNARQTKIKKKDVRFQSEEKLNMSAMQSDKPACSERENHEGIISNIKVMCKNALSRNELRFNWAYVSFVAKMMKLCSRYEVWNDILKPESISSFVQNKVLEWLKLSHAEGCASLMTIVLTSLRWLHESEIGLVLCELTKIENIGVLENIFNSAHASKEVAVKKWLTSESVCTRLDSLCKGLLKEDTGYSDHRKSIFGILRPFFMKFSECKDEQSWKFVDGFVKLVLEMLQNICRSSRTKLSMLPLVCDIFDVFLQNYQDDRIQEDLSKISLLLFQLACLSAQPSEDNADSVIVTLCRASLERCTKSSKSLSILKQACRWVRLKVTDLKTVEDFEHLLKNCLDILLAIIEDSNGREDVELYTFMDIVFYDINDWNVHGSNEDTKSLLVLNEINGGFPTVQRPDDLDSILKLKFTRQRKLLFMAAYSTKVYHQILKCNNSQSILESDDTVRDRLFRTVHEVLKVTATYTSPLYLSYETEEEHKIAKSVNDLLVTGLQSLQCEVLVFMFHHFLSLSKSSGHLAALILQNYLETMPPKEDVFLTIFKELVANESFYSSRDINPIHTYQVLLPHINQLEQLHDVASTATSVLISRKTLNFTDGSDDVMLPSTITLNILSNSFKFLTINEETNTLINSLFQYLGEQKKLDENILYINKCFDDLSLQQGQLLSELIKLLTVFCDRAAHKLSEAHWDFLMCCLGDWIKSLHQTNHDNILNSFQIRQILCSVSRLLGVVAATVHKARFTPLLNKINLVTEWHEFFAEAMFSPLLPIFVTLADSIDQDKMSTVDSTVLAELTAAFQFFPRNILDRHLLPMKLIAEMETDCPNIPNNVQSLLNHLCPLLMSSSPAIQLGAYFVLLRCFPTLSKYDSPSTNASSAQEDDDQKSPPVPLLNVLKSTNHIVDLMLDGIDLEEIYEVNIYTNLITYTRAHFFCWNLLLAFFSSASSEMRSKYACYIQESGLLSSMLSHVFKLMPSNYVTNSKSGPACMFTDSVTHNPKGNVSRAEIQHLACSIYYKTVKSLPALVRQWWNRQDKRTNIFVEKYTAKNVSGLLSSQEIEAVHSADENFKNMTIKTRPVAREVVATYTIDEVSMELVVQLPTNHPLGPITVESGRRVGVGNSQWRTWMLQLTTFLMHQNGSILEGLILWKKNVDKRFEGVEECMICFYVLHGSTCQLPKLTCRTCKKKFHSDCLYKWFNTSNKSSCPLCRNLF